MEFEAAALGREFFSDHDKLVTMFKYFDIDGNGYIDAGEITDCFKRFGRLLKYYIIKSELYFYHF